MPVVSVTLDFACYACAEPVQVVVECKGPGLRSREPRAAAYVPCPYCGRSNEIVFDPQGIVHRVAPSRQGLAVPVPSIN